MESLREDKDEDQPDGTSRLKANKRMSLALCLNKPGKNFSPTIVGLAKAQRALDSFLKTDFILLRKALSLDLHPGLQVTGKGLRYPRLHPYPALALCHGHPADGKLARRVSEPAFKSRLVFLWSTWTASNISIFLQGRFPGLLHMEWYVWVFLMSLCVQELCMDLCNWIFISSFPHSNFA